jgi:hypothetical protein
VNWLIATFFNLNEKQVSLLSIGHTVNKLKIPVVFLTRIRIVNGFDDWMKSGLPDGIFSKQKSKFGQILEGLAMEYVGLLFIGRLVYFTAHWYI